MLLMNSLILEKVDTLNNILALILRDLAPLFLSTAILVAILTFHSWLNLMSKNKCNLMLLMNSLILEKVDTLNNILILILRDLYWQPSWQPSWIFIIDSIWCYKWIPWPLKPIIRDFKQHSSCHIKGYISLTCQQDRKYILWRPSWIFKNATGYNFAHPLELMNWYPYLLKSIIKKSVYYFSTWTYTSSWL